MGLVLVVSLVLTLWPALNDRVLPSIPTSTLAPPCLIQPGSSLSASWCHCSWLQMGELDSMGDLCWIIESDAYFDYYKATPSITPSVCSTMSPALLGIVPR